jgi:hypothetical protein
MSDGISKYANQFTKLGKNKDKKTESETKDKTQSKTHAETKSDDVVISQTKTIDKQEVKTEKKLEEKAELETISIEENEQFVDPADSVFSIVESGRKKKKMEDERIRRTHWFHPDEIKMIDKLSKITGLTKYDVVGTAIRSMYERAMQINKKT